MLYRKPEIDFYEQYHPISGNCLFILTLIRNPTWIGKLIGLTRCDRSFIGAGGIWQTYPDLKPVEPILKSELVVYWCDWYEKQELQEEEDD
jgi:hypothetical protein